MFVNETVFKPPILKHNLSPIFSTDVSSQAANQLFEIVYNLKEERKYEKEHGWKEQWFHKKVHLLKTAPRYEDKELYRNYLDFIAFEKKWSELKTNMKVPGWYHFDPRDPEDPPAAHNMIKEWDEAMFNFLKDQKWNERKSEKDDKGRNQYEEKAEFVVDCSQLLGIGGEAVVIRKSVAEKVGKNPETDKDREYEALKIIPIMKHNFEDEDKVKEMQDRVDARQKQADPEHFFPPRDPRRGNPDIGQR